VAHPRGFRELRRTVEFTHEFATNAQGLRHRDIPLEKPPGTYRILVVGDSMTEGVGVEGDETFSAVLERRFARAGLEFINGGLGGTGVFEYGRLFLSLGLDYQIDALLVAVFSNDVSNASPDARPEALMLRREGNHFFGPVPERSLPKRVLHALWPRIYTSLYQLRARASREERTRTEDFVRTISEEARRRGIPEATIEAWRARLPGELVELVNQQRLSGNVLSYGLLNPSYCTDSLDIDTPAADARFRSLASILTRIAREARQRGIEIAVVYLPDRLQYDPATHRGNPFNEAGVRFRWAWLTQDSELQRRLAAWATAERVPFLDLTQRFRAWEGDKRSLHYPIDGHWTPAGHRVAANAIGDWLEAGDGLSWHSTGMAEGTP
jgi:lysophospholipase L1-like esterase